VRGRFSGRLLAVVVSLAVAGVCVSHTSLAAGVGHRSNLPAKALAPGDLPRNQPLIVFGFKHEMVTTLTGTAVPFGATIKPRKRSPKARPSIRCSVKLTNSTRSTSAHTTAKWFGRISCTRSVLLVGQAYLQETATKVDGQGRHYLRIQRSASSGRARTVINSAHPSVYIRYLTSVYFRTRTRSGQISVYPAKGQVLNRASTCVKATFGKHRLGVRCDLYTDRTKPKSPPTSTGPAAHHVRHIVWVIMENHSYEQIIGDTTDAPYINSLVGRFGSATQVFAEGHPSLPNYVAMTSGSTQGISDDSGPSSHPLNVTNIFGQLSGGGSRSLIESIPSNCDQSDAEPYAVRHNPEAYYTNLGTGCANFDVPFGSNPNLSAKFTFIVPNECHDMHSNSCSGSGNVIAQGDQFLESYVPRLLHSPQYLAGDTVIFVTWDEDSGSNGDHIPTLILDPFGAHTTGSCASAQYTHYSMLRYVEDTFGLPRIGAAATATSMRGCFGLP
jgi:phosphatidylinositol-3-phosphatase